MRYRMLSSTGDFVFGGNAADFLVNSPAAVAQAVETRLNLELGTWFIDVTDGTPWATGVLGYGTAPLYDLVLKDRIVGTIGVSSITSYASQFNPTNRALSVQASVGTIYGAALPVSVTR